MALPPPNRELSPAVREIALRGPAPRAKPVEPHPALGALFPRIQSGVEGAPNPLIGDKGLFFNGLSRLLSMLFPPFHRGIGAP